MLVDSKGSAATRRTVTTDELRREVDRLKEEIEAAQKGVERSVIDYEGGDRYEGDVTSVAARLLRDGKGRHACMNGDWYEGEWKHDLREGNGELHLKRGSVVHYKGEWKEDLAHGKGTCLYRNGSRYEGAFVRDARSGWGTIWFGSGERYEGEWENDTIQGQGIWWTRDDLQVYKGTFVDGEIVKGTLTDRATRLTYEGSFCKGSPHGDGILWLESEWKYKGSFLRGHQSGYGVCQWHDGKCYEGQWKDGERHGQGKLLIRGACVYEGTWNKGQKHGEGRWILPSGDRYSGNFVEDMIDGHGAMLYANGTKYKGEWQRNERQGFGVCIYANGDKYKGQWVADKRHGQGMCRFADGTEFCGQWKQDAWVQSAASPEHTIVRGDGLLRATAGDEATFTIEARDEDGQRRLSGGDIFHIVTEDTRGNVSWGKTLDQGDGTYTGSYRLVLSGSCDLYILSGEKECVAESPYRLEVLPARPCLKKTVIDVSELRNRSLEVHQKQEFFVAPCDAFGNPCTYEDVKALFPVEVWLEGEYGVCSVAVSLGIGGHYHCAFVPQMEGRYRLFATSNGRQLPRSPLSIQVGQGSIQADRTTVVDEAQRWKSVLKEADILTQPSDETAESRFIKEHPDVPVVTDLGDLWKLGRLQKERKKGLI